MKLLTVDLEKLDSYCSINLDDIVSIEPDVDLDSDEIDLKAWTRLPIFSQNDSHDFYIVSQGTDDLEDKFGVEPDEAAKLVMKLWRMIVEFWEDDSRASCYINDELLSAFVPKFRK